MGERKIIETPDLIGSSRVAQMTGFTLRWVQTHAANGDIPGATRFAGEWRFDEAQVRLWIAAGARKKAEWQPYISAAKRSGVASSTKALSIANRLKQRLGLLPSNDSQNGSATQRPASGAKAQGEPTTKP